MSKRNRKFISLIIMIVFLIITLTASTYAWFTTNQNVEVTNIEVKARASQKIDISVDARTWKSAITLYDILNAEYFENRLNQVPNNFQAYSTVGNLNDGLIDMFHGFVSMDKNVESPNYGKMVLTAEKVQETDGINGGFLTFDLYLKNDLATNIYLGKKSYVNYVLEDSGIENTIRIAFVFEGTLPIGSDYKDIQALKSNNRENVIIWEPNCNKHTEAAILNASKMYDMTIVDDSDSIAYYGVKKAISYPEILTSNNEEYFESVNTLHTRSDYSSVDIANNLLFYLPEGISKIRVYSWIEGQDIDCENKAAGSDFEFNFNFTTRNKES